MKGSVDNFSGIVFGKNSDEIEGITNYVTPHLGYKHDDKILMFTSEQYKFNLSNDNFQTLQPFSTLDSNGLSIGIEHPINRLSIFGNNGTDVSMCIVAVGDNSYPSSEYGLVHNFPHLLILWQKQLLFVIKQEQVVVEQQNYIFV